MRYKSNKGTNTSTPISDAGDLIPHVAHGILKKMRMMNYNTTGKKELFVHPADVELFGNRGGGGGATFRPDEHE